MLFIYHMNCHMQIDDVHDDDTGFCFVWLLLLLLLLLLRWRKGKVKQGI